MASCTLPATRCVNFALFLSALALSTRGVGRSYRLPLGRRLGVVCFAVVISGF